MKTFRFLDFPVYQDSKQLYKHIVELSKKFPREHWELADPLRRAALSVCLNIAEGSAKYSDKDFKRFLENALGSINESVACLDIALDNLLISQDYFNEVLERAESVTKQLGGLSKKLRSSFR
jgi:four helix bundle protein